MNPITDFKENKIISPTPLTSIFILKPAQLQEILDQAPHFKYYQQWLKKNNTDFNKKLKNLILELRMVKIYWQDFSLSYKPTQLFSFIFYLINEFTETLNNTIENDDLLDDKAIIHLT